MLLFQDRANFLQLALIKLGVGIIIGIVWFGAGAPLNSNFSSMMGAIFLLALEALLDTMIISPVFNIDANKLLEGEDPPVWIQDS